MYLSREDGARNEFKPPLFIKGDSKNELPTPEPHYNTDFWDHRESVL